MALDLDPRRHARALAVLAAGGVVAAGLALQRAHMKRLAGDPDWLRLSDFRHGLALPVHSADGTRIHAEVFGPDEAATVVLAPGWTEQLSIWTSVIAALRARDLRIVAYDLRGHGGSGPAAGDDYSLQRFGEDVEAVLRAALPDGRRAIVVGHSLGGMAIAAWAERHNVREHACGAALVNTGFSDLIAGNDKRRHGQPGDGILEVHVRDRESACGADVGRAGDQHLLVERDLSGGGAGPERQVADRVVLERR